MTGFAVALLLAAAGTVLVLPGVQRVNRIVRVQVPGTRAARASGAGRVDRRIGPLRGRRRVVDVHELPLFVHQLAGLLRAGRPPHLLWGDMERVYLDGRSVFAIVALPVLATARRAAEMGLSVPDALHQATGTRAGSPGESPTDRHVDRLWVDLAGCLIVAERSGAPLAGLLEHYALQLEAQLEGLAARDTALAGPRATVLLLAWLPALGLVLAFALGVDPFAVLLGSPAGLLALVTGVLLMVAARIWSTGLVRRAGGGTPG